jgi:hypothetical protein
MAQVSFVLDTVDAASLVTVGHSVNRRACRGSLPGRGMAGSNRSGVAIAAGTQRFFSPALTGFSGKIVAIRMAHTLRRWREAAMKPLRNGGEFRRGTESGGLTASRGAVVLLYGAG